VLFTGKTVYLFQIVLTVPNDPDYYIVLGEPITRPARYSIADLSLIKNITHNDPFNDLTTDIALKTFQNANAEAEKQAKDERSQKEQQISNDYNTEQLKATTDSESTLELMLRSVLLFGINNVNNTTGPKYDTFIQDLFSEGAYTTMFNNGAPGKPDYSKYDQSFFEKYINGTLTPQERLDTNFRYGNNFYLMSGENAYKNDSKGSFLLKNQLRDNSCNDLTSSNTFIPQVNFDELFKIVPITYGESSDLEVNKKPQLSVFINLGLFFLMLNHTGILYNADTQQKIKNGDVITPMAYLDFNPETNFYLSSINQISIDPYKFLVSYNGTNEDYLKMFDKTLIKEKDNKFVIQATPPKSNIDDTNPLPAPESDLFNFNDDSDKLSAALPEQKKRMDGKNDGYVGKLMYIMVDINYLLDIIKNLKNNSDTNEVYFQSTIEQLLSDLNKSMGNYNAFRLSYNDSSNCFVITDDQIQSKPDSQAGNVQSEMIKDSMAFEIPIYGKRSIARAFELRTDISSRLASMLAISSNPGASNQVATAKNTSDFGVYNTGSFDRYIPMKTDTAPTAGTIVSNIPAAELATNFNNVIKSIYGVTREDSNNTTPSQGLFISKESIERARTYYIDRMAKIKNEQSGSIHAMIIPLKSNITMDGMAGLYPFQLYTIDERILPYRYSSINLSEDVNQKKVAFSIARMTHTISNNEWTTSVEGFMTLLRNPPTDQNARSLEYKPLYVDKNLVFGNAEDNTALPQNANTVYNFFIGKGLPDFIAAAFVGNFWQESRLNPNAINSSSRGRAIGIAQWLGDRKNGLLKKSNYTDLQTQLKFVWEELNSVESNAFIIIKSSTDVDQATINIRQYYERPGLSEANDANRKRIAALILKNPNTQIA
jgi:hypothetical protein